MSAHALPEPFLERLRCIVPASQWSSITQTFTEPKPTTFRVNTLKATVPAIRDQLTEAGLHLEPVPWYCDAFILRRGRLRELQETVAYRDGAIYVQSLSSMLPALVLDPQPGEAVLDLTAAPGSKTTQIACLMQHQGRITANDNNKIRFYKLRANVIQQGVGDIELTLQHGETFGTRRPNAFDRVLVDAPCSAEGRFLLSEPKSYRFWRPGKIHEMARKQRRLLRSAIEAVRPGGVVVYSTCTFAPEENEGVIDWALAQCGDAIEVGLFTLGVSNAQPGLTQWEGASFHPSLRNTRRILPTDAMEGFFIARLRKSA